MMIRSRRFFLTFCAAGAGAFVFVSGRNPAIAVPADSAVLLAGECSFCMQASPTTAGIYGRPWRLCRRCAAFARDMTEPLSESLATVPPAQEPPATAAYQQVSQERIDRVIELLSAAGVSDDLRMSLRSTLEGDRRRLAHVHGVCSFCDAQRREVPRMIVGPRNVCVCSTCVETVAALFATQVSAD